MKQQILEARLAQIEAIARDALTSSPTREPKYAISEILLLCERWRAEK